MPRKLILMRTLFWNGIQQSSIKIQQTKHLPLLFENRESCETGMRNIQMLASKDNLMKGENLKSLDRDEVAEKLAEKGATKPCHRCGHNSFTVLEGYTNIQLQDDFKAGIVLGGPSLPVVHIACNNCGAITSHALGALTTLPKEETTNG